MKVNYNGVLSSLALKAAKTDNIAELKDFASIAAAISERIKKLYTSKKQKLSKKYSELSSAIWLKIDKIEEYENA